MPARLFTIGHSTHALDAFLALLHRHGIEALVDIRRFPGSRRHPHFHRDNLSAALQAAGIEYQWLEALGGRRRADPKSSSQNLGLRNASFRNYADYMLTPEFQQAAQSLLEIAQRKRTAFMCAEGLYWQCHRRLVSDFLSTQGISVEHIMPSGELRAHRLTEGASLTHGRLSYPAASEDQRRLFD